MSIERGKAYQWEIKKEAENKEETKNANNEDIHEIDAEVEGKQISK